MTGTTDKAVKIATVAIIASVAAYFGYQLYKERRRRSTAREEKRPPGFIAEKPGAEAKAAEEPVVNSVSETAVLAESPAIVSDYELAQASRSTGNELFKRGDYQQAIEHYSASIKQYPAEHHDLALSFANRAACYLKLGRFDAVISDCTEALKIEPEFTKALDRRSKAYEQLHRLEDALVDITAACIIDDFKTESLVQRVESMLRQLSTDQAQKDFETKTFDLPSAALIDEFLSTFPKDLALTSDAANFAADSDAAACLEALRSKSYRKCAELAEKVSLSSESEEAKALAHELVGTFQFLRGDIKAAGASLAKALECQPNESNVLVKLALVELEHNDFPKMTESLEKAFAADPKNPALYYHRGEILALSGNLEGAIRDFSCAIELCPDFHLAYVHNSRALLGLHKIEEAGEALLEALKEYPNNAEIQNGYGEVLVMKGEYSAAEKVFDGIIKKEPTAVHVYLNKALLAMNQSNDITSAEMHLRAAIKLDPSFMAAHLQLANLLLSNGKTVESMQHFDDALRYARTLQELVSVHSLRCASMAQVQIAERFPTLASKMK